MRIYIDVGHGENGDPGAVSGRFIEHQMNMVYGMAMARRLADRGMIVDLERGNLPIGDSARAAAALGADAIISCHENAGGGDRGEVIYGWGEGSEQLANVIAGALKSFGQSEVRVYSAKANSAGNAEYFGILRVARANGVRMGVIIEPCFIDNPEDVKLNDTDIELQSMASAIADAIADAYGGTPRQDTAYEAAVGRLVSKGIVNAPGEYWKQAVASNTPVKGEWLAVVIQGMTGTTRLQDAVAALAAAGVIGSPDYWLANCQAGQTVQAAYAKLVIENGVNKLKL